MAANDNKIINTFKEIKQRLQKKETDPEIIGSPDWKEFNDDSLIPLSSIFSGLNETSIGRDISKHLNNIMNTFDRDDRYDRYRLAMKMPEIDGALDIYASETATQDEKGNVVNVFCSSSKVEKIITDLFDRIGIEDKGFDIIKSMCGYGDEIYEIIYSKNGKNIHSINMIPREYVGRYEENGVLKNFFIRKSKKNREQRDSYYSFDYARINTKSENIEIEPFRILHWRINNSDFAPYGKSILDSVITPLEELRLMEQSLLLARISRAPERRLYYVNVGQAQGEKGIAMAREIVKGLKRKSILDRGNGNKLDSNVDFFSSTEDLVIPFRKDEEKSSVESLPQLNDPGQLQDLEFIRDRIFPGLGIPRQYLFDDTFSNANTALSNKSVQFAKRIRRIQKFFIYNLYKLAYIELKLKNIPKKEYEDLLITMNNPSNVDIREKLETESNKWNLVSSIKSMNSEKVFYNDFQIYQDVLGLNYDEILKLMVQNIVQEKNKNPFAFVPEDKRPSDFLIIDQLKMEGQEEDEEGEETGMEDVDGDGIPDEAEAAFGDMEPEGEVTPEEGTETETPEEGTETETPEEETEIPLDTEETDLSDQNANELDAAFSAGEEGEEIDSSDQNANELIGAFSKKGKKTKETDLSNQNADELIGAFDKKGKKTKETDLSNKNADEIIDIFSSFKPSDKKKKEIILEQAKQRARRFTMKKLRKIDEDLEYDEDEIEEFQNEIKNNPKYTVPIYTEDYLKISSEFLGIEKIQEKQTYFEEK